jgi:hypothetical protein
MITNISTAASSKSGVASAPLSLEAFGAVTYPIGCGTFLQIASLQLSIAFEPPRRIPNQLILNQQHNCII